MSEYDENRQNSRIVMEVKPTINHVVACFTLELALSLIFFYNDPRE